MANIHHKTYQIDNQQLEVVSEYKYLGQIVFMNDGQSKEIHAQITAAWRSNWALKHLFKSEMSNFQEKIDGLVHPPCFDIWSSDVVLNGST